MPTPVNVGTRDIPLQFAKQLTEKVQADDLFLEKVTPVTRELLRFWFEPAFCENRQFNFHQGQRQAIKNVIYTHEILKTKTVLEMYEAVGGDLLAQMNLADLKKPKYQHPKYAVKMATGTGKTWVIQALLIWQFLNAKHEAVSSGLYSKNFLLVAPGLMIYERLLNAFLGKEEGGKREFKDSDFWRYQSLFAPPAYKDEIFAFVQNAVCGKDEIGRKVTGDGIIAVANWHSLVVDEEESIKASPLENPSRVLREILPVMPGTTAGNSLESLDRRHLSGGEIEFLRRLKNLTVINDEAHHIHENKTYGDIQEVEWQKSLNYIAEPKETNFIQLDFSATPYDATGTGEKRTKHYFPHVIVDFDLKTAIRAGLVKTIALDKRKELAALPLEFRAERDGREVAGLSDGQKIMLRAGISKIRILEEHFKALDAVKHPKMFVICEDTKVAPKVVEYLIAQEGLDENEVIQIDSDKKGSIPEEEWLTIKEQLFNIDKSPKPKVIVSVLMLREGFDVSNICVIVPLRSSQSQILLEQIVGRGLRLMWREPDYQDIKKENIESLLVKREEPKTYMDLLSIIEHPAFEQFYKDLVEEIGTVQTDPKTKTEVVGDLVNVGLKSNYKDYDLFFPLILLDREEHLVPLELSIEKMQPFQAYPLEKLKQMVPKGGDIFYSQELTVKTNFGEYEVRADLFNSKSYNEFVGKIVRTVAFVNAKVGARKQRVFPVMQINQAAIASAVDRFIRQKLFGQGFDPLEGNNWRILMLVASGIVEHVIKEVSRTIYDLQNSADISEASVLKKYFSSVPILKMRESYCLDIKRTIYERQSYPSNKGGLEKDFMLACDDNLSNVGAFVKINEHYHDFAKIAYVRADGVLAFYSPDFVVKIKEKIFIVETKAQDHLTVENVRLKQAATVDWVKRVNQLNPEDRMSVEWEYVLLGENTFRSLHGKGASILEILEYAKITEGNVKGTLF